MQRELLIEKMKQNQVSDFYTPEGLHIFFKDSVFNNTVDVEKVISRVESVVPQHLRTEIEMIIVGDFPEFHENGFNAFFRDGMIHISNDQENNSDMIDDIIHEIAHSIEEPYGYHIYGDNKVKQEFLEKRYALHNILWKNGYKAPKSFFNNTEYDKEFEEVICMI